MNGGKRLRNRTKSGPVQGAIVEAAIRWRATQFVLARLGPRAISSSELQTLAQDHRAILFALIDAAVQDSLPNASIPMQKNGPLQEKVA
jgi:hypothetical protein